MECRATISTISPNLIPFTNELARYMLFNSIQLERGKMYVCCWNESGCHGRIGCWAHFRCAALSCLNLLSTRTNYRRKQRESGSLDEGQSQLSLRTGYTAGLFPHGQTSKRGHDQANAEETNPEETNPDALISKKWLCYMQLMNWVPTCRVLWLMFINLRSVDIVDLICKIICANAHSLSTIS